ncbi:MAG: hypothetical protein JW395_0211 [Nitrospira sp.]|nr:hypothetical protein [Nitrospira sp.]
MSNKTFIPAFQCAVGDWKYYICMMKYGEVARQVGFAYELQRNPELGQLIQRGLSSRTKVITDYLLKQKHRFLGALVVAAWGGEPRYTSLAMDDPDGMLAGLDREFGVLMFDGTQQYFALDGQHRLKAIKDALKEDPEIGREDICVLIVTHYDNPEGRLRTRRLFSNINRNAQQTKVAENIALDEDDGFSILTRRMLEEHQFLSVKGRVRVILSSGEGEVRLASGSVPKTDASALTTFTVLYDLLRYLGWDCHGSLRVLERRPSDDVLEKSYGILSGRIDDLLNHCGEIESRLTAAGSARDLRAPKDMEESGHPFMRPVVQKAVAKVVSEIVQQNTLQWPELMKRLTELEWKLEAAPWLAVFSVEGSKMRAGKDDTDLLAELLHAHLAPTTLQSIKRARKAFKDVRGINYSVSEEELAKRIVSSTDHDPAPVQLPDEISASEDPIILPPIEEE